MRKLHSAMAMGTLMLTAALSMQFSSQPPQGRTGATGVYCNSCHSTFALNTAGGSVVVNGLPGSSYTPNQAYPFTLTINHSAANRLRWGFSIAAMNGSNTAGSFSSNNPNAAPNGNELSHDNAVSTAASSTYTYNNLVWTAPATPNLPVTFYYVGNAANGNGANSGDYIYSGTSSIVLPAQLSGFSGVLRDGQVQLQWQTSSEINTSHFAIQRSEDGQIFSDLGRTEAAGQSNQAIAYHFTDARLPFGGRSIWYRLRQVDRDGRESLSASLRIELKETKGNQVVQVMPTLVRPTGLLSARLKVEKQGRIRWQMTDMQGRTLATREQWLDQGTHQWQMRVPHTASKGWLMMQFTDGKQLRQTLKVLVE